MPTLKEIRCGAVRQAIIKALKVNGSIKKAAISLGITKMALYANMRRMGIPRKSSELKSFLNSLTEVKGITIEYL